MQSVSARFWTRVAVFISYDDNDYTTGTYFGLHSVGRLTSRRFCRVCLDTGDFLRTQGAIPRQAYTPFGGLGLLPGAWRAPKRGMPTGPKVFLALPDACGFGPATGPTLKRPCAIFVRWLDATINNRGPRGLSRNLCISLDLAI